MKIVLAIVVAAFLLIAFNKTDKADKASAIELAAENRAQHSAQVIGLSLNNGVKWKSDPTTWINVSLLQKIVSGTKKDSLDNYLNMSGDLEAGLNKMIRECKMKGPDHEALHHWLEPLIEKTTVLKNSKSVETAAKVSDEIEDQLNLFPKYFDS